MTGRIAGGAPALRRAAPSRYGRSLRRPLLLRVFPGAGIATIAVLSVAAASLAAPGTARASGPIPALAYYYIWYNPSSWNRAKRTYPLLGRYSSDDVLVMRRHVALARGAGLDGFIVSWKSTPTLNRRLSALIRVADAAQFKLAIVYQGLDFSRNPLPAARVASDIAFFAKRFGSDRAFSLEDKPIVIWTGTWRYTPAQIRSVARRVRDRVLLLASEKSVEGYQRLGTFVDGNAYYWSSVDPATQSDYGQKLDQMSAAVHRNGGLWIAPAAPGFDARLVGGTRNIERLGGDTLRREWSTAMDSSPDAIGLISWNEFSENSEVEPTTSFGTTYLGVLSSLIGRPLTIQGDFDSSAVPSRKFGYTLPLMIGFGALLLVSVGAYAWRRGVRKALDRTG
jgi:Glycosyl hydrolase family 71